MGPLLVYVERGRREAGGLRLTAYGRARWGLGTRLNSVMLAFLVVGGNAW
jgi:hypothetical protein